MARSHGITLLLVIATAACASQVKHESTLLDVEASAPACNMTAKTAFKKASTVFRSNPSGLLQHHSRTVLTTPAHDRCVVTAKSEVTLRRLVIETGLKVTTICCSLKERLGIGRDDDGNLFPFSDEAFKYIGVRQLHGVNYREVKPVACPAIGCPLVVEVAGHESMPWLQVRSFCKECNSRLGVVIISPVDHEYTGLDWVNSTFVPWVRRYIAQSHMVDKKRVYLVTESKGNEIGLSACLAAPDIFSFALFNGKFMFTADMWSLVMKPGSFKAGKKAGLKQLSFHLGDIDPIFPDEQFYANFTKMLAKHAHEGQSVPKIDTHIYPGRAHDTSFGVWNQMTNVIWTGIQAPC